MNMVHTHTYSSKNLNKAFLAGIILNSIYIVVEFVYGLISNSMALIADAGHNVSDVLGLMLAWGAMRLALRSATPKRTYGMRKSTILAALFNSVLLMTAVGAITIEAIRKFLNPVPVEGNIIIIVAGIGVLINSATAFLFLSGKDSDINVKGAFLHMAADAGVSLGVVAAGFVINFTDWLWVDPVMSLIIVLVITWGTWGLLKEAFNLSMDAVPSNINPADVRNYLENVPGVKKIHDLHIWAMSTTESALTVHIVKENPETGNDFLGKICRDLHEKFGIGHTTIQVEGEDGLHSCTHKQV